MPPTIAPNTNPIGVIMQTSLTPEAFDAAWGGGGYMWLQEHGLVWVTIIGKSRLDDLGLRLMEYQRIDYDGELAMAFRATVVGGPSEMVDTVVVGTMVRPVVPGALLQGFIYRVSGT